MIEQYDKIVKRSTWFYPDRATNKMQDGKDTSLHEVWWAVKVPADGSHARIQADLLPATQSE